MRFLKSIRPSHVGLATIHIWIYCITHRPSMPDEVSFMAVMYLALSACLALVAAAALRRALPEETKRLIDWPAAACMAAAALLGALPASDVRAATAAALLGGVGVGWAYMRWGEFYARLDIHYAAPLVFFTMAVGSVGKTAVDFLPPVFAAPVLALLPAAVFFLARRSLASAPEAPEPSRYYNGRTVGSLRRLVLGIAVYSLIVGVVQSMFLERIPSPYHVAVLIHHGGEIVLASGLLLWVTLLRRGLNFSRTWRLVLVLMATSLIFAPYLEEVMGGYLFALVRIAQTFLIVFLFLALSDVARHSVYRPMAVFAAGWLAYALPFAVGKAAGDSLAALGPNASAVMSLAVWVLVVATLFFLDESSAGSHVVFTELNDGGDEDTLAKRMDAVQQSLDAREDRDLLALRCEAVTRDYGLTPRESEILELLARGRSKAYIADAFFISENTVRGHVKRVYAKLGVHSKQELLDTVESALPR